MSQSPEAKDVLCRAFKQGFQPGASTCWLNENTFYVVHLVLSVPKKQFITLDFQALIPGAVNI